MKRTAQVALLLGSVLLCLFALGADEPADPGQLRAEAAKLMQEGNWNEAYERFSRLALDPKDDQAAADLRNAVNCLQQLGRISEFDAFIENVITAHPENWSLLKQAAHEYMQVDKYGFIIAGEFQRGHHRGGTGKRVYAYERDRVRALQLMLQAIRNAEKGPAHTRADLWSTLARYLLGNRGYNEAWRLQYLTDLAELPDYEEAQYGYHWHGRSDRGAPVDAEGNPIFHALPESWEEAQSDGERWRWCLAQTMQLVPARRSGVMFEFAQFHHQQFGVQTLAQYSWFRAPAPDRDDESGKYAVHTLGEEETIARLATGVKRFKLPDEFNYIRILRELADGKHHAVPALDLLANVFENRRQYPKAAEAWRRAIAMSRNDWREKRLNQIVGNRGTFEPVMTQPSGEGATVDFRFRNGTRLSLDAYELDVERLLTDVKNYLKSNPRQLDWNEVNVGNIGWRIVRENQKQYIGNKVASWTLPLDPRPNHWERRITVNTPLQRPGAYLLTAQMEDGNTSRVVIWVADTAIVKKPMPEGTWCFVADAVTGRPIPKANVEFFGYRQEWVENLFTRGGHHVVHTANTAEFTDADGQVFMKAPEKHRYQWIIIARTDDGRLAWHGFTGIWTHGYHDREYNQTKTYVITDRPVYRPNQPVKFKCWINQAQYDREGKSPYAGRRFTVEIHNPRNEKEFSEAFVADAYGGISGEFMLGEEPVLGVYRLHVVGQGGSTFRVEEYKKPEFEVTVEAPEEPVMLGEKVTAKIQARYYFGAPVVNAKVKVKITRTDHSGEWYPIAPWDWLYGRGYWWFAYDYAWYPGWHEWGCFRPSPWWWPRGPSQPPELVAEVEQPIGPKGIVEVEIDTALAKEMMGDTDHRYEITAEVTDQSRRTIVGQGEVLVAREPFKVYAWVDHGHYRVGDVIHAGFRAQTLDRKGVEGQGALKLLRVDYRDGEPVETPVQEWDLDTNSEGYAEKQITASRAGQYRLSYTVTDGKGHTIEGGYVFVIAGEGFDGRQFRFNQIELVPDKQQYAPGETINLMLNTDRVGSTVVLFVRPANGVYLEPKVLRLDGKSVEQQIEVAKRDMPNFFVEAITVSNGKVYTEAKEIAVPPESRVLDVEVTPSAKEYKPGETGALDVRLTGPDGKPFVGSVVVAMYDKAVEYISGGSNVPEIMEFFWKWRRHHHPRTESSLDRGSGNLLRKNEEGMARIGVFGGLAPEDESDMANGLGGELFCERLGRGRKAEFAMDAGAEAAPQGAMAFAAPTEEAEGGAAAGAAPMVEPTVRTQFADTALWIAALTTDDAGRATVKIRMPENLTTWKTRVWAMGGGTRCGEATTEVITTKNLIVRLQAPRFFVQKDEVVLSANVHNYLDEAKRARVSLELEGGTLQPMNDDLTRTVEIEADGEIRVDWRVQVVEPGEAVITVKALTDEESDAMQMRFPVFVHGMLKTESFSGNIRPDGDRAAIVFRVPAERKPEQSRLEIRYSPTLAGAMVDALPYLAGYPYGCTEQTLNRFLPSAITQKILLEMELDLAAIKEKRTNLNAQEIGDDVERAKQWKRFDDNPVFDEKLLRDMVKAGVNRLASMQCSDGGWGWFSGWGERSYPHTTALVVHGLQIAQDNEVALIPGMLERGVAWLTNYQQQELERLERYEAGKRTNAKDEADNMDAYVYMVLVDAGQDNEKMRAHLYKDRNNLSVYAKAMFGIALHRVNDTDKRDMLIRNIEQFLVEDDENQTAYLELPNGGYWWYWYGSEMEAHAYYLKLLCVTDPTSRKASRLVKYLINNRKHATYWNSTRDTAVAIEALADYIRASGEDRPDMTLTIRLDGEEVKQVKIDKSNLFTFDNKLVLEGEEVTTGEHRVELIREGTGPVYFNAYLTNFTLEDPITKAGLEIKVTRDVYKLVPVEKTVKVEGARGQALDQRVEKYERQPLANLDELTSGDLVEVELVIESKNDYEYIIFEDMKGAGFEPVEVRSGYNGNEMGAYVEHRDERTVFFVRMLPRGKHSVSYRLRAEIPGRFSALPAKGSGMYAPELKANSDEIKLRITD